MSALADLARAVENLLQARQAAWVEAAERADVRRLLSDAFDLLDQAGHRIDRALQVPERARRAR